MVRSACASEVKERQAAMKAEMEGRCMKFFEWRGDGKRGMAWWPQESVQNRGNRFRDRVIQFLGAVQWLHSDRAIRESSRRLGIRGNGWV